HTARYSELEPLGSCGITRIGMMPGRSLRIDTPPLRHFLRLNFSLLNQPYLAAKVALHMNLPSRVHFGKFPSWPTLRKCATRWIALFPILHERQFSAAPGPLMLRGLRGHGADERLCAIVEPLSVSTRTSQLMPSSSE